MASSRWRLPRSGFRLLHNFSTSPLSSRSLSYFLPGGCHSYSGRLSTARPSEGSRRTKEGGEAYRLRSTPSGRLYISLAGVDNRGPTDRRDALPDRVSEGRPEPHWSGHPRKADEAFGTPGGVDARPWGLQEGRAGNYMDRRKHLLRRRGARTFIFPRVFIVDPGFRSSRKSRVTCDRGEKPGPRSWTPRRHLIHPAVPTDHNRLTRGYSTSS